MKIFSNVRKNGETRVKGRSRQMLIVPALLALLALPACRTTSPQTVPSSLPPGPSEQASDPGVAEAERTSERPGYTEADVRFMQGMIAHHAQAVRMSSLVPARSSNETVRVLAKRIGISQRDEIALMQRWLRDRGQTVPHPDFGYPPQGGHDTSAMDGMHGMSTDAHHGALMAGMLTPEQMAQLAAASGTAFDRLFLQGMIQHHEGALTMVAKLFGTRGAAQDPLAFELANEIGAVQRSQITRMHALLAAQPGSAPDH